MVNVAHQHGIHLHALEAGVKRGVDARHDLMKLILPGDGVKLTGVEAVDADVDGGQPGITPLRHVARQAVAIGGDGDLADRGVLTHRGDDVGEITAQGGFPAGQAHFFGAERGKGTRHPTNFIEREETFIGDAAGLVAIRQAVGATKVADVGDRQT